MKTSDIEVRDMLSVLSVVGVENRIGEVPGVESVTVNFAAGLATVRYDETRLNVTDIKSAVRQGEYEAAATSHGGAHEGHADPSASPATLAPSPKSPPDAAGAAPAGPKGGGQPRTSQPGAPSPPPVAAKPSPVAAAPTAADKPAPDAGAGHADMKEDGTAAMDKA